MPAVIDISNSSSSKKKPGKAPPPKRGPKPAVLIALGIGLVIAVAYAIHFMMTSGADGNAVVPYDAPQKRNISAPNGGATGGSRKRGPNVAPGLPGDGG